ncbi:hypothetical protein ACIG87_28690 [Micromonospora sp. NPDC051925]|uniref:hypothetical protein n=1 Tax=Micromonospora sp. NPDC051925 TaxID=3364288 RepID=UPI0037C89C98
MTTILRYGARAALATLTAGILPWQPTTLVAGVLAVCTAMGLLAEWQARGHLITTSRAALAWRITYWDAAAAQTVRLVWTVESDRCQQQART